MAGRRAPRDAISREQWAKRVASDGSARSRRGGARATDPITVDRIVDAALRIVETSGYDDLTMRSVATALGTGPASLYAHVRSRAELGDLLIGRLCDDVRLPDPDPHTWREQFLDVCHQVRDLFLRYPGVAQAALAVVPADLGTLRVAEGMLGILVAGGATAREASWTSDAAILYITAYCLEDSTARRQSADRDGAPIDRAEIVERLRMLPADEFPHTVAFAQELGDSAGGDDERFDFAIRALVSGGS